MLRRWRRLTTLVLALAAAVPAAAQVTVTTLAEGETPVDSTAKVRVSRFADLSEADLLRVGDVLGDGDLLSALDPSVLLELTCPRGSLLHFGNGFRVLIQGSETADCAAAFLAGDLDVLTDHDTEVSLGGRTVGTLGTRYAVKLSARGPGASRWIWVFEGKVGVAGGGPSMTVDQGKMAEIRGRRPSVEQPISESEVQTWAGRYAAFDLVKAKAAGVELSPQQAAATRDKLAGLYVNVLSRPDDKAARLNLAQVQVSNRIGAEAIHNLKRSGAADQKALDELKINPATLRRGDPQIRERVDKVIANPGLAHRSDLGDLREVRPAGSGRTADDLEQWLVEKAFDKVVEAVKAKRESGYATAREYCLAAQAYAGLGNALAAAGYARHGFTVAEEVGGLADGEAAVCRRLITAAP